jgi:hypothetical protein
LHIPHRVLASASVADAIRWARETLQESNRPVALLLPPGVLQ